MLARYLIVSRVRMKTMFISNSEKIIRLWQQRVSFTFLLDEVRKKTKKKFPWHVFNLFCHILTLEFQKP